MHDDEQQLIVSRRVGECVLQVEKLADLQIAPVRQAPVFLTEARRRSVAYRWRCLYPMVL
jgi:hypothetical protein